MTIMMKKIFVYTDNHIHGKVIFVRFVMLTTRDAVLDGKSAVVCFISVRKEFRAVLQSLAF